MLSTALVLFSVFRLAQPDQFQPVHFIPATQQSRSKYTRPDDLSQNTPIRSGNCSSEAPQKRPFRRVSCDTIKRSNSNVVPSSKLGGDPSPVCLPLSSQSCASVCAIPLPVLGLLSPSRQWSRDSLSTRVLCWRLVCTHRRMRLRVTS